MNNILNCLFIFIIGLFFGSFIDCLSYRIINNYSIFGRSKCENCGHLLKINDLIPVFSYLSLNGKCRYCKKEINKKHLFIEIMAGILFLLFYIVEKDLTLYRDLILIMVLMTISIIDYKKYIIPDVFVVIGLLNYLFYIYLIKSDLLNNLINNLIMIVIIILIVLTMNKLLKKESMGMGDIKLLMMVFLYFDLKENLYLIIIACIIGLLICLKIKKDRIPFGPCISISTIIMLFIKAIIVY